MNCPNGHGTMAETKKGFACQTCFYTFVSVDKPKSASGGETRNAAINEANRLIKGELIKARLSDEKLAPWQQPWIVIPKQNYVSGHQYKGMNRFLVPSTCEFYVTEKKAVELGGTKKEEARPFHVWCFIPPKKLTEAEKAKLTIAEIEKAEKRKFPVLVIHEVYQYTDWNLAPKKVKEDKENKRVVSIDEFFSKAEKKVRFVESGNTCVYHMAEDVIYTPGINRFDSAEDYYRSKLHELIHATGSKSRLDRYNKPKDEKKRADEYGYEELVAEIGANYLARFFGLSIPQNSISYLDNWLKAIEGDSYMLMSAAQQAEKAVDWLLAD